MPMLQWNEIDFLECLAVEPDTDEYSTSISYEIERDGLKLLLTIWLHESVIQASLFRTGSEIALYKWAAYVRGEVRFVNDGRGRYLEFDDCIIAPNRFWYQAADNVFDQVRFPHSVNITLAVDPDIRIEFVNHESRT